MEKASKLSRFFFQSRVGYTKVFNHLQPPTTIHNHPQPPNTIQKTTHNHSQTSTTIHNHPKITQKSQDLSQTVMLLHFRLSH